MTNTKPTDDLSSRTRSGLKWNTSLKIISQLLRFVVGIMLARILEPVDFGIMAIGHMVINYTNSLSDFGFINALVQKRKLQQVHINSVFTLNLAISGILCLLVAVSAPVLGRFFHSPESAQVLLYMSSLFILRTFRDVYMALLRRDVLFKAASTILLIESFTTSATALLLALMGLRYWALVWATILATMTASLLLFLQVKTKPRLQYRHQAMKKIYHFGFWNFLRAQLFFINQFLTQLVVGKFFGPTALGFFEKSHQLASTPRESIAAQINAVMFSSFSRIQADTRRLADWFHKIILMETILVVPILAGMIAVADQFIIVVLGEKWAPAIIPLRILALGVIFQILNGLIASLNVGIGQYKRQAFREIPGTILFLTLCFPLSRWGINGIAACYTISMLFISCITFHLLIDNLKTSFRRLLLPAWPYLLINGLMAGLVIWVSHKYFSGYSIKNLLLLTSLGAVFYTSATACTNILFGRSLFFPVK